MSERYLRYIVGGHKKSTMSQCCTNIKNYQDSEHYYLTGDPLNVSFIFRAFHATVPIHYTIFNFQFTPRQPPAPIIYLGLALFVRWLSFVVCSETVAAPPRQPLTGSKTMYTW